MGQWVPASCFAAFQAGWSLAGGSEQKSGYFFVSALRTRFAWSSQAFNKANEVKASSKTPNPLQYMHRYASLCPVCTPIPMLPNPFCWAVRQHVSAQKAAKCSTATSDNQIWDFPPEYSLFYGGNKTVETRTPVDIFKQKIKARLFWHINEDDHDRGPSVTVNRAGIRIWATAHDVKAQRKALWKFKTGSKYKIPVAFVHKLYPFYKSHVIFYST